MSFASAQLCSVSRRWPGAAVVLQLVAMSLVLTGSGSAQLLAPIIGEPAALARGAVPAAGRHTVELTISRCGRYAVWAHSEQGVALQLVDRMAGPTSVTGIPGQEDGRIDTFLDEGVYKLVVQGDAHASGDATLFARPFTELSSAPAPQLVERRLLDAQLGDLEQRSYWLVVEGRSWFGVEAAGRSLGDLRLWRDGSWLVDAEPQLEVLEPHQGRPLQACRLVTRLEPGLYLLTAYGAPPQPWSDSDPSFPLHLRWGAPTLATNGRARHEMSPFGIDRFLVPAEANFYRLELAGAAPASLSLTNWAAEDPYTSSGAVSHITKRSRLPVAELGDASEHSGFDLVTITAEAGTPYLLQHMKSLDQYPFTGSGDYWISTIHSGHPGDAIEATAFLAHWEPNGNLQRTPLREQTVSIGSERGWSTRANLLAPLSLFVHATSTTSYVVETSGVEAEHRIEPFFVYQPRNYKAPPFRRSGFSWELEAGYYVLTLRPEQTGVLDLSIRPAAGDRAQPETSSTEDAPPVPRANAWVRFPTVQLYDHHRYTLFLNQQPEVRAGVVLRRLPMSLVDALPLTLVPDERVDIPFTVSEPSLLTAVSEDGDRLAVSLDDGAAAQSQRVATGQHIAHLHNPGSDIVVLAVTATPERLLASAPLPTLPLAALDALPSFPVLTSDTPHYLKLARHEQATFVVRAAEDALYRLETTGLLDTSGTLRSRVITSLAASASGGSGRNFLIQNYLAAGDYQLSLTPQGSSTGHLGLQLRSSPPREGGQLHPDRPARITLADGESVLYHFTITEPGRYTLRSLGLGDSPRCRLEDADGWPLVTPGEPADLDLELFRGDYHLILLPSSVGGRRVTLLSRIVPPLQRDGHGPHQLPLGRTLHHTWLEPASEEAPRLPDVWHFELPAATEVRIVLSPQMQGVLTPADDPTTPIAKVGSHSANPLNLTAGSYRLEITSIRRNNRLEYSLQVAPQALVAGMTRSITAPTVIPVAIGDSSLVEISSFGTTDVMATLVDAAGARVLYNDDRTDDWNFYLSSHLPAGAYTLHVFPVGASSATTSVTLMSRHEVVHEPLRLPAHLSVAPEVAVHTFPLPAAVLELLVASTSGEGTIGLAVELADADGSWHTHAVQTGAAPRLELPLATTQRARLKLWSIDQGTGTVTLAVTAVTPPRITERQLHAGYRLEPAPGAATQLGVVRLELARPGVFRLQATGPSLRCSPRHGQVLKAAGDSLLAAPGTVLWIAADLDTAGTAMLQASRLELEPGENHTVQLPLSHTQPSVLDLTSPGAGPLLVSARSMIAQPAVRLGTPQDHAPRDLIGTGISSNVAVAVSPTGAAVSATAWLAEPVAESVDARITSTSYPAPRYVPLSWGRTSGALDDATTIAAYRLPAGSKRCLLTMEPGLVAVTLAGEKVAGVHLPGSHTAAEQLVTAASGLLLLQTQPGVGYYTLEVLPASGQGEPPLTTSFEELLPTAGIRRVAVGAGSDDRLLHVWPSSVAATFVSAAGQVHRGSVLDTGPTPGYLMLSHEPGLAVAWFGPRDNPERALWSAVQQQAPESVTLPAALPLSGEHAHVVFSSQTPGLLSLQYPAAAAFRLTTAEGTSSWLSAGEGTRHLCVGAGRTSVELRGLAGAQLGADLELLMTPLEDIGEGLGPVKLLTPGSAAAYRFSVARASLIGVGVRARSDTVQTLLLTSGGEALGEGVIQQHELEPGTYVLLLQLAPDEAPVWAQPALVGTAVPPTGPPVEVIRDYLTLQRSGS